MLRTERYLEQLTRWPREGRLVLAQFDATSVVVYQAYRPDIGQPAARDGRFGAGWSRSRMSWVKPGFLWMMFRSGWGTKPEQETVLAIHLARDGFDTLLKSAVPSSWDRQTFETRDAWSGAVARSDVRVQWDPDHDPHGNDVERRALQLGLRGELLARFADEWILRIEDITPFVRAQHERVREGRLEQLETPREDVYLTG